jgi:CheY-like chemotaxis protein
MVVDDESDIRLLTRIVLEGAGYDVVEAPGGRQALEALAGADVDLMILDIRMTGMDGWEVMTALTEQGAMEHLRVLAFSAHVEPKVLRSALDRGCVGVLVKPFTRAECLDAVRAALS